MKLTTSPLFWDLDVAGNVAPAVTPTAGIVPLTFNLSNLEGRTEDLWNYLQAIWVRVTVTVTQASSATALNYDKLWQAVDSIALYSPLLGDLIAQRSGQGAAIGLIDQVIGAGYKFPTPVPNQISSTPADYTVDLYFRVPLALDVLSRPQDGGIWAPLLEKGRLVVNLNTTAAGLFQANASIKAASATVRAWAEVLPFGTPQIHAPSKFVRYEFNTQGTSLKLFTFGSGDGLLGINPGARLSLLLWLSSNVGLGGVDTVDKWTRVAMQWRKQKLLNNPEALMGSFLAHLRTHVGPLGSYGATVKDVAGWPYTMAGGPANGVLDSTALFYPLVWPGYDSCMSGFQKQIGDLAIDAGFTSNPNGTHVFRALEHYSWTPSMIVKLISLMGFDVGKYTAEPKTEDNSSPRDINPAQLWGLPLRVVARERARMPLV